jgi:hypothetical protein
MATTAATYRPTKPEIYDAIGVALADPAMVTGAATDASVLQEVVAAENPNWRSINARKFKKYQKRVIAAREAGIDPKDAGKLVSDDASVSTVGSMVSRAKKFVIGRKSSSISASKQDDVSDIASTSTGKNFGSLKKVLGSIKKRAKASTPGVPGSIGAGVEYSAVAPPIPSDGTADITPNHSDRELDLSTSAYADDNDGTKGKDECCAQGCIIL